MASSASVWVSTPNKKDNLTSGWTSKTLFNFQLPTNESYVGDTKEVFNEIINIYGTNYKGTNVLPKEYFAADNYQDSRTFKITMLFDKLLDGEKINFDLGLYDMNNYTAIVVDAPFGGGTINLGGTTFAKLEYYCCVFYDTNDSSLKMSIIGTIMYEAEGGSSATTIIQPYDGYAVLPYGTSSTYSFSFCIFSFFLTSTKCFNFNTF